MREICKISPPSVYLDKFPFYINSFYFEGERPNYFVMKAGGNILGMTGDFEYYGANIFKIKFYDEDIDLPLHLVKYMPFEFICNVPGRLLGVESYRELGSNYEIDLKNGIKLTNKAGVVGLNKNNTYWLSIEEYTSYRLKYLEESNVLDTLCLVLFRDHRTYLYLSDNLKQDTKIVYELLKKLFDIKYQEIFDSLPEDVKLNKVSLGYSTSSDKIVLHSL